MSTGVRSYRENDRQTDERRQQPPGLMNVRKILRFEFDFCHMRLPHVQRRKIKVTHPNLSTCEEPSVGKERNSRPEPVRSSSARVLHLTSTGNDKNTKQEANSNPLSAADLHLVQNSPLHFS